MKIITCLFVLVFALQTGFSQSNNYDSLWKEIEALEKKGLPKSALDKLAEIRSKAETENNRPQIVKALLFKSKYALTIEEDAQLSIIKDFKDQIQQSTTPTKNVLEGYLANLYWQYFQQNRYQFYNRTRTSEKVDSTDFRTWDLETLFSEIDIHFEHSLRNDESLKNISPSYFGPIIEKQEDSDIYRPTLFDLLAHNALNFYKTDENSITKPAQKFKLDNETYLAKAETFQNLPLSSPDSTSLKFKALKIFQNLISFHLKERNVAALVDVDIERLLFVKNNSTLNNKEDLFVKTLRESVSRDSSSEYSALYEFEIANLYATQAQQYNPKSTDDYRWKLKDALEICNSIIERFPQSHAAEKSEVLKNNILTPTVNILTEKFLPVNKPSKLLVRYKNLAEIEIKIYKITQVQLREFNSKYRKEEQQSFLNRLQGYKEFSAPLKNESDYQEHSIEIALLSLENGNYILSAITDKNQENFAAQTVQVTDMALVEKNENDLYTFQIIDRLIGKPIVNANVDVSYQIGGNQTFQNKSFTTDKYGQFYLDKSTTEYRNIQILVTKGKETAYFENIYTYYDHHNATADPINYSIAIFTDRSIYRPSQTVYFKAIAFRNVDLKSEVMSNERLNVKLFDVNRQEIRKLELLTNEFGSVTAEFILPTTGLTGQYYIEIQGENKKVSAETNFSVEEYKRPKFKVEIEPNVQTVKVNDTVNMMGKAVSYAGSAITDAKVVYRVYRKVQLPIWYYWSRPWFNSEPQEITSGEALTDNEGNFQFKFKALPDESVDKKNLPIFHYEVTVEVTDINGETRMAEETVNVGYHTTIVDIIMKDELKKSSKDEKITIETRNLNGEKVVTTGTLQIFKLLPPNYVLRNRPWENPDYQSMTKEEFKRLFPYEAYGEEDKPTNWEKGEMVFSEEFRSNDSTSIVIKSLGTWKSGLYLAVAETQDNYGQLVKDEKQFKVSGEKDREVADNQLFQITTDKEQYSIGDELILTIGTAAENLVVTIDIEKDRKVQETYIINLKNEKKFITIPIDKTDLGGFAILYSYAYMNDFESGSETIAVPYPKSDLQIETITFRDKIKPGTQETWEFKIQGPNGEKVSSELLASMYDLSLDQFMGHEWKFNPLNEEPYFSYNSRRAHQSFGTENFQVYFDRENLPQYEPQQYTQFAWFGLHFAYYNGMMRHLSGKVSGLVLEEMQMDAAASEAAMNVGNSDMDITTVGLRKDNEEGGAENSGPTSSDDKSRNFNDFQSIIARKNLEETAFFFPQLKTDSLGNVRFTITTPEALTTWKLQLLAHTKNLGTKVSTLETVTQKELMVVPNAPRFLREGDEIVISSKISNLSDRELAGRATLKLIDPFTEDIIEELIIEPNSNKEFTIPKNGNAQVSWNLKIPKDIQAIQYKILAKAGELSDGEQNALPVLSNRKLVTETLPMWVKSNETRIFSLEKLKNHTSTTLTNHKLTLEVTSNPAWYAVQALPYLMEYPFESNEHIFARIYANSLASYIANSNPRIKEVFDQWASADVLISNLENNEELKSILIEHTPWLRDAQNETEQKKRIGLLFNMNKMRDELRMSELKLQNAQLDNGAWAWFKGGLADRYITQYIVTGFGHLKKLEAKPNSEITDQMFNRAIQYLDEEFIKEYTDLTKYDKNVDLNDDHLSYSQIYYLYMRSYFPQIDRSKKVQEIMDYYKGQIQKYWISKNLYSKGLMALIAHRDTDKKTAEAIVSSLKETSITNEELGMYWKENTNSWHWYQAPIETQSLMIEAFSEITNDKATIDNLKIWLLKNKQTNNWKTTKATTEASYALLLRGSDWLSVTDMVSVEIGNKKIDAKSLENVTVEAGTGYFKTSWDSEEITKEMSSVKMGKKGEGIAWGSLYWQYFEDLDKITTANTPLQLTKKLFKRTYSDSGELITQVEKSTNLKVGDLVRVRIELKVDRDMEYIHMQDMRAAGLEPINVISSYNWQDGLGYYQSTKDASTNFFFDYLPKGIYVFEYDLRVNNAGNMSNGITTIQSMYAPEFSSHSEGVRISVDD